MKKSVRSVNEPQLKTTEWIETDPESGTNVRVVRNQRGVLVTEARHYDSLLVGVRKISQGTSVRETLEDFCDSLRDYLESEGLPSDRAPQWIRINRGEWQPDTGEHRSDPNVGRASWIWIVEDSTEQLSRLRLAGQLLFALTQLMSRKGIDEHLWYIDQAMFTYRRYCIAGSINVLAASGIAARKARAAGPSAKQQHGRERALIICEHAHRFRQRNPLYKHDASNTAARISADVNKDLKRKGLLPAGKKGLSIKTIADRIRQELGG